MNGERWGVMPFIEDERDEGGAKIIEEGRG